MSRIEYEVPEIAVLNCELDQVLCLSNTSGNVDIGIGDWGSDEEDYGGNIK